MTSAVPGDPNGDPDDGALAGSSANPPERRRLRLTIFPTRRRAAVMGALALLAAAVVAWMIGMPGQSHSGPLPPLGDAERALAPRLRAHVEMLATEIGPRHVDRPDALETAAQWIEAQFVELGLEPSRETFDVAGAARAGARASNIVAESPGTDLAGEIVIVGAHYDSVPGCPAANDNASGVAGLFETARTLLETPHRRTLRYVAFVNEEPPWFQTDQMGSHVHARGARERGENIVAMISLETIGYYRDEPGTQQYPPPLGLAYPDTGNFIAFVGNVASRSLVRRVVKSFRSHTPFPSEGAALPGFLPGISWSDHWAFWEHGYPGVMVTDTAPFRYPHYHDATDTPEHLDFDRMARVVAGVTRVIDELAD